MPKKIDDAIFDFAYVMAMRDATQQQAFLATNKKLFWQAHSDEGTEAELRQRRDAIKGLLKNYIDGIFDGNDEGKTVPNFYEVAGKVQKAANEFVEKADMKVPPKEGKQADEKLAVFSFGNTQKLINMTAKYMFMATYERPELRGRFEKCHCPMDSIVVDEVIKQIKKNMPAEGPLVEKLQKKYECRDKKLSKWTVYLKQSWSSMTEDDRGQYDLFQELVRYLCGIDDSRLSPIEFDFRTWQ